ncbi:hypothetical protein SO802_015600 [Lithocarpus litseifolius]|uniref:Equilibrative nucleoside transporter n=1 Tax=Lithocarpus litseifolius TaxID=425828 RepID=A0AAW2CVF3_9ROSI
MTTGWDKGRYVAIVSCWLLGNGCLYPYYCTITTEDYFSVLFLKYHSSRVLLAYQPFAFVIISVLAFNEAKINTRLRNLFGYILFFLSSLSILVLNLATSGKGGLGPFIGICIICAALGVADGLVHGGMLGELFFMQHEFIQSFVAGLAAAGALASALRLVTKAAFENTRDGLRKGALLFFAISSFFEFLCVLIYAFVFPKLPIVKYYRLKTASEGSKTVSADLAAGGIQTIPAEEDPEKLERLSNKELLLQNIDYALDIFLISLLTLSIFPGFLSEDTGKHSLDRRRRSKSEWVGFKSAWVGFKSAWMASARRGRVWWWGVGGRRWSSVLVASRGSGSDRRRSPLRSVATASRSPVISPSPPSHFF